MFFRKSLSGIDVTSLVPEKIREPDTKYLIDVEGQSTEKSSQLQAIWQNPLTKQHKTKQRPKMPVKFNDKDKQFPRGLKAKMYKVFEIWKKCSEQNQKIDPKGRATHQVSREMRNPHSYLGRMYNSLMYYAALPTFAIIKPFVFRHIKEGFFDEALLICNNAHLDDQSQEALLQEMYREALALNRELFALKVYSLMKFPESDKLFIPSIHSDVFNSAVERGFFDIAKIAHGHLDVGDKAADLMLMDLAHDWGASGVVKKMDTKLSRLNHAFFLGFNKQEDVIDKEVDPEASPSCRRVG